MIFTRLSLTNFLSYNSLEFDLNQGGAVLVIGKNGGGKSAIFDAIAWCLFGITLKGLKGDEVIANFSGKNAQVSLEIEEDSKVYTIVRYRKHKENGNSVKFYQDGEDLTAWSIDATQKLINQLLGMDVRLFTNSVMFAQGHSEFFASLSDKDQKELIETFIDTSVWSLCLDETKKRMDEAAELFNGLAVDLEKKEDKVEYISAEIAELEEKKETFESDKQSEVEAIQDRLDNVESNIKSKQKALKEAKGNLEVCNKLYDSLAKLKDKQEICSKCKQKLPFKKETEFKEVKEAMEAYDREVYTLGCALKTLNISRQNYITQLCEIQAAQNVMDDTIQRYTKQVKELIANTSKLKKQIEGGQKAQDRLKFWVEGFGHKGIKSFLFENLIPEFNHIVDDYTEIMTEGEIQVRLSATSQLKSGETREKFSLQVYNSEGSNSHKGSSAGERRSIDLSILWTLQEIARNKLKSAISFEVLDEALDTLDDTHVDSVLKVINKHSKQRTVFVVSHNDNLKNSFDKVYMVDKHKGKSQIYAI